MSLLVWAWPAGLVILRPVVECVDVLDTHSTRGYTFGVVKAAEYQLGGLQQALSSLFFRHADPPVRWWRRRRRRGESNPRPVRCARSALPAVNFRLLPPLRSILPA